MLMEETGSAFRVVLSNQSEFKKHLWYMTAVDVVVEAVQLA